jgi:hypothetical protein
MFHKNFNMSPVIGFNRNNINSEKEVFTNGG